MIESRAVVRIDSVESEGGGGGGEGVDGHHDGGAEDGDCLVIGGTGTARAGGSAAVVCELDSEGLQFGEQLLLSRQDIVSKGRGGGGGHHGHG